MAAVESMVSKQNRQQVEQAQGTRCACDDDRPCLLHYDQLGDLQQSQARKRAGVSFGHGNGR